MTRSYLIAIIASGDSAGSSTIEAECDAGYESMMRMMSNMISKMSKMRMLRGTISLKPLMTLRAAMALIVGLVLLAGCAPFGTGAATPSATAAASATPTPTVVVSTPTPNLAQAAPQIIATWLSPVQDGPCPQACSTLDFTTKGPMYLVIACDGFQQFADSLPTFAFTLYDGNGHQADAFQRQCGDPNHDVVSNIVIPEALAAGKYSLAITSFPWECSVTVIDASRH